MAPHRTLFTVLVCLVAACNGGVSTEASDARSSWIDSGLADYRIVYTLESRNGMGGAISDGRYSLVVSSGEVIECEHISSTGRNVDGCAVHTVPALPGVTNTPVDYLFQRIETADPAHTTVSFDPEYSFPVRVEFDDPATADDEWVIRVVEFEPLEPRSHGS